ncbi:hypothetical protein MRY82_05105 [bacterium]|nr:hypothetical protein [bacterium]
MMKNTIKILLISCTILFGATNLYARDCSKGDYVKLNNLWVSWLLKQNLDTEDYPAVFEGENGNCQLLCEDYQLERSRKYLMVYSYINNCNGKSGIPADYYYWKKQDLEGLGVDFYDPTSSSLLPPGQKNPVSDDIMRIE